MAHPVATADCIAWYRGDSLVDGGGGVASAWNDKTANGYNLTANNSPTIVTSSLNGRLATRFVEASSDDLLQPRVNASCCPAILVACVALSNGVSGGEFDNTRPISGDASLGRPSFYWDSAGGSVGAYAGSAVVSGAMATGAWRLHLRSRSTANQFRSRTSTIRRSARAAQARMGYTGLRVGNSSTGRPYSNGDIAEVAIWNKVLNSDERNALYAYYRRLLLRQAAHLRRRDRAEAGNTPHATATPTRTRLQAPAAACSLNRCGKLRRNAAHRPMKTLVSWSTGKDRRGCCTSCASSQTSSWRASSPPSTPSSTAWRCTACAAALLEAQADAAGLPLHVLPIPYPCPNETYEAIMGAFVAEQAAQGVEAMAFGDLFLEDIRRYREAKLAGTGIAPLFPIWGIPTARLARDMIAGGLEARITCVDPSQACPSASPAAPSMQRCWPSCPPASIPAARTASFTPSPAAGPMFSRSDPVETGEIVTRDGFVFCDLLPATGTREASHAA